MTLTNIRYARVPDEDKEGWNCWRVFGTVPDGRTCWTDVYLSPSFEEDRPDMIEPVMRRHIEGTAEALLDRHAR